MAQHADPRQALDQGLLAIAGNDCPFFAIPNRVGILLGALRLDSARLLFSKAGFCHRDSVCHLNPRRSRVCARRERKGDMPWR